jgi:hypothetical protein
MRLSSNLLIGMTLFVVAPTMLVGQESMQLESGARVRLISSVLPADQQVGRIVATSNDTVVFRSDRNPVTRSLALTEITAVDVSMGKSRGTRRGAGMGLLVGAGLGAVLGYTSYEPCEGFCLFGPSSRSESTMFLGAVGGTLGLVIGTTFGFLSKSENWQRVRPNTQIRVAPAVGGGRVSMSYAF